MKVPGTFSATTPPRPVVFIHLVSYNDGSSRVPCLPVNIIPLGLTPPSDLHLATIAGRFRVTWWRVCYRYSSGAVLLSHRCFLTLRPSSDAKKTK